MRNLFYSLGIASFLVCMIFTIATSITNPFYGMSDAAVAQATTQTTTTGSSGSYQKFLLKRSTEVFTPIEQKIRWRQHGAFRGMY